MTNAGLIRRLIEEAAEASDWRSSCADSERLPVFNLWGPVMYLTPAGEVVIDHEEDRPTRLADPAERAFALARAAETYPELAHLKPPRPPAAATCNLCSGHGRITVSHGEILPWQDGRGFKLFFYCPECSSLGWTLAI